MREKVKRFIGHCRCKIGLHSTKPFGVDIDGRMTPVAPYNAPPERVRLTVRTHGCCGRMHIEVAQFG